MSLGAASAPAATPTITANAGHCSELVGRHMGPATVKTATLVPASGKQPEHCKVVAYKTGRAIFLMQALLPTRWDRTVLQQGIGGAKATIPGPPWNATAPIEHNMVMLSGAGGHNDPTSKSLRDPEVLRDWSYGAIDTIHEFGQAATQSYYGAGADKRYFLGCSGGGLDALQAAAIYPDRYDGVVAQAPPARRTAYWATALKMAALPVLKPEQWNAVNAGYVAACDADDNLKDGIVSNPGACKFDPTTLPGWTAEELRTLRFLYNDVRLKDGTVVARRMGFGPSYADFHIHSADYWGPHVIAKDEPDFDPKKFDVDVYWPKMKAASDAVGLNIEPTALASFVRQGKKLMIVMGLDDTGNSVHQQRAYYDEIQSVVGSGAQNLQLRWIAGITHCGAGGYRSPHIQGPDRLEMLGTMRDWVEKGVRPTTMIASRQGPDGAVKLTRPVCQAGEYVRYSGRGDPNRAENFACTPHPQAL